MAHCQAQLHLAIAPQTGHRQRNVVCLELQSGSHVEREIGIYRTAWLVNMVNIRLTQIAYSRWMRLVRLRGLNQLLLVSL